MSNSEDGALVGCSIGSFFIGFILAFWLVASANDPSLKELDELKLQLAQPDPHAVEIVRTDEGELIVVPKGTTHTKTGGTQ